MSRVIARYQKYLKTLATLHTVQTCNIHQFHLHDHHLPVPEDDVFIKSKHSPLVSAYNAQKCTQIIQDYELGEDELVSCKIYINPSVRKTNTSDIEKHRHFRGLTQLATQVDRNMKVLVVAEAEYHKEAMQAGAAKVITPLDLPGLKDGKINIDEFDQVMCTPSCVIHLHPLGRILQVKMPHERKGTVTRSIAKALTNLFCSVEWSSKQCLNHDMTYVVDINFGRGDFTSDMLSRNLVTVFKAVINYTPGNVVGEFVRRCEIHANGQILYLDFTDLVRTKRVEVVEKVVEKRVNFHDRNELKDHREKSKEWTESVLKNELEKLSRELQMRWTEVQST